MSDISGVSGMVPQAPLVGAKAVAALVAAGLGEQYLGTWRAYYESFGKYVGVVPVESGSSATESRAGSRVVGAWRKNVAQVPPGGFSREVRSVASLSSWRSSASGSSALAGLGLSSLRPGPEGIEEVFRREAEVSGRGNGYCYLHTVRPSCEASAVAALGAFPVSALLKSPEEWFEPDVKLKAVRAVVDRAQAIAHLGAAGETSALTLMCSVPRDGFPGGTLGSRLSRFSSGSATFVMEEGFVLGGSGSSGRADLRSCPGGLLPVELSRVFGAMSGLDSVPVRSGVAGMVTYLWSFDVGDEHVTLALFTNPGSADVLGFLPVAPGGGTSAVNRSIVLNTYANPTAVYFVDTLGQMVLPLGARRVKDWTFGLRTVAVMADVRGHRETPGDLEAMFEYCTGSRPGGALRALLPKTRLRWTGKPVPLGVGMWTLRFS